MHHDPDAAVAARPKVVTLAHYRGLAAQAEAERQEPTFTTPERVADVVRSLQQVDRDVHSQETVRELVGHALRTVLGVHAVFGAIRIDLGDGHTLVCSLERTPGARA